MKYNELIQFESLDTVIQLLDANKPASREKLVSSYVISDEMADRINSIIFPQVQFDDPRDNKGLLVVGNYGTGKSHLMSVISSIAEDASLVSSLGHEDVKKKAVKIAGKFKVVRAEIGASTKNLRDIIISELEMFLEDNEITYKFPASNELTNHKDPFAKMMAAFDEKYPDHGFLFVIDELLDFLRRKNQQELIYDLSFLREIGEICEVLRFRFIAGVQEAIFDSSLFAFYGPEVRRVRERFETVSIVKEDIKYVVSQRLLKKTADQTVKIREHISRFTKFYYTMNEKIEDFVNLFPVHPDYIDTFESLRSIEKREILRVLSQKMKAMLDSDVPAKEPGLIAFDSYWAILCSDPSFRTLPDVKAVINCSKVLEERVNLSLPYKQYTSMAIRIIHGLSVHRLTVGDIFSSIGASAEELRDRLCLYNTVIADIGGDEPDKNLLTHIETVLKDIYSTVNGQFITKNKENNQYYLDLKKSDDYEAKVEQRAASLSPSQIDECYYKAIMEILECPADTFRTGFKIWPHNLIWYPRKASRRGYLFLGTPNERSTTVPPLDFYIYFLEPFASYNWKDEKRKDEVFFTLEKNDEEFVSILKLYGGAVKQEETSSGDAKKAYQSIGDAYLKRLVRLLKDNRDSAFSVTYQGQTQSLGDFTAKKNLRSITGIGENELLNFKDFMDAIAEQCLEPYFNDLTPDYPIFSIKVTEKNREQAAQDALKGIASGNLTYQAKAVLSALELFDGNTITPTASRYSNYVLSLKQTKVNRETRLPGQVINRDEIIISKDGVEYFTDKISRLEPEWVVVVLAALVSAGEIVLATPTAKYDAAKLPELAREPLSNLINFKHLEQSKEHNLPALQALFKLFNLPSGMAIKVSQGDNDSVAHLQDEIIRIVKRIVELQNEIKDGIRFWDFNLLELLNLDSEITSLSNAKTFFESLQRFDSPGKLKNLNYTTDDISQYTNILGIIAVIDDLMIFSHKNTHNIVWIKEAESCLKPADPWTLKAEELKNIIKKQLLDISLVSSNVIKDFSTQTVQKINELKEEYINTYSTLHSSVRLNAKEEKKKHQILRDPRFLALDNLAKINILPKRQVEEFMKAMNGLIPCTQLTTTELKKYPICPYCGYKPVVDGMEKIASRKIEEAEDVLEKMLHDWTIILLNNLSDSWVQDNMKLLRANDKTLLDNFIDSKKLPSPIYDDFIMALNEAFSTFSKVQLSIEDVRKVLQRSGGPFTPGELKDLFDGYIDELTRGKDLNKVRIVIE